MLATPNTHIRIPGCATRLLLTLSVALSTQIMRIPSGIAAENVKVRQRPAARVADDLFLDPPREPFETSSGYGWENRWKLSPLATPLITLPQHVDAKRKADQKPNALPEVVIHGTTQRNNPLRRKLAKPYQEDELYVGFQLIYEPNPVEADQEPEFFVLWLDRLDGSDKSLHNNAVPNIGLHLADRGPKKGRNTFMIRTHSNKTEWSSIELKKGKTYFLVARLSKSNSGLRNDYDQLKLWVNPRVTDYDKPSCSISKQQSVNQINWVGFATGRKTEPQDTIRIGRLILSRTWQDVLSFSHPDWKPVNADIPGKQPLVWNEKIHFRKDIYPILKQHCFECHSGEFPDAGYRLDVRDEILGYSTGEPFVIPGRSHKSRLVDVITTNTENRMPPEAARLNGEQVAKIRAWIDQGFDWDDNLLPTPEVQSDHWAFQKIERPELPDVKNQDWVRTPIDAFIAARHESANITPAKRASRRMLVRRLYLDLLGLPPTPKQLEDYLSDESPDAYQTLVEKLLASPHYGERWGRYWLDLVRWAESQGYQHDIPRPFAWRYRDYVIQSFNADKPYNQFLREQLAGDELSPLTDEHLIATGFLASARISGNQEDKKLQRNDVLVDIVNNTSSVVLGLTMECAQCHNHKFEPLTQRDYYRMLAFFARGQLGNLALQKTTGPPVKQIRDWMPASAFNFYMSEAKKRKIDPNKYKPHAWGYYSPATGHQHVQRLPVVNRSPIPYSPDQLKRTETHILIRGDVKRPGLRVDPGWPMVLGNTPSQFNKSARQSLADWLESAENPLVARVWVNRIWQYHFGRGLVSTSSDFGTGGAKPTHPKLLDWLGTELIANNWSTKHIHRLIINSSTYQQSSLRKEHFDQDPENRLLWKWRPRRLQAEAIRDSMLVTSGELDPRIGGPSIPPHREADELRRTIYLFQRRSDMPAVMTMFDAPDAVRICSRREVSTVALQPLYLLNSSFVLNRARTLATQINAEASGDQRQQVELLFRYTLGRLPDKQEMQQTLSTLRLATDNKTPADHKLIPLAHAMLNLNEFMYMQ